MNTIIFALANYKRVFILVNVGSYAVDEADGGSGGAVKVVLREVGLSEGVKCFISGSAEKSSFVNFGVHSSSGALDELIDLGDQGSFQIILGETSDSRIKGLNKGSEELRLWRIAKGIDIVCQDSEDSIIHKFSELKERDSLLLREATCKEGFLF